MTYKTEIIIKSIYSLFRSAFKNLNVQMTSPKLSFIEADGGKYIW